MADVRLAGVFEDRALHEFVFGLLATQAQRLGVHIELEPRLPKGCRPSVEAWMLADPTAVPRALADEGYELRRPDEPPPPIPKGERGAKEALSRWWFSEFAGLLDQKLPEFLARLATPRR